VYCGMSWICHGNGFLFCSIVGKKGAGSMRGARVLRSDCTEAFLIVVPPR
jgi:hypothetical protein